MFVYEGFVQVYIAAPSLAIILQNMILAVGKAEPHIPTDEGYIGDDILSDLIPGLKNPFCTHDCTA
jgi:hypothetical protein